MSIPKIVAGVAASALAAGLAAAPAVAGTAPAAGPGTGWQPGGPMAFTPIAGSAYDELTADWTTPFVVPDGYTQRVVADENTLDIYSGGVDDLSDMITVNETGPQAGRYLYRTHEVGSNGSLSVVDLRTGEAKVLAQRADWRRLDGLEWTPWGTLLFAEETDGGRLFEAFLHPADPTTVVAVQERPEVGILRHEGINVGPDGAVYVVDELNGGSIYRFVPARWGILSDGQLYALKLTGLTDEQQKWDAGTYDEKVGAFTWVPLDMGQVVTDANAAADAVHATEFGRPEDVQLIGHTLYVANTSEDRVVAIDLRAERVTSYVQAGRNVPVEDKAAKVTGFNSPDNLAKGPDGKLWIVEDNVPADIWVASESGRRDGQADRVALFASLRDSGAEGTGIYFAPGDARTLYVDVQHPDKPLADGTWAISRAVR